MRVVVGLGNPGRRYEHTPHNVGFAVADELSRRFECPLRRSLRFKAKLGSATLGLEKILLVQPGSYMNNSGSVVGGILRYRKVAPGNLVVVLDDVDLDLGRLRIRSKGGTGGHRGLASILQHVGSDEFVRVRVGVGRDRGGRDVVEHVLSPFASAERGWVDRVVAVAADAVECVLESGADTAMNKFNGMQVPAEAGN